RGSPEPRSWRRGRCRSDGCASSRWSSGRSTCRRSHGRCCGSVAAHRSRRSPWFRQRTLRRAMLVRTPLDWTAEPADAALLVRGDVRPFALCGAWAGGGAVAGSEPVRVAREDEDPFALLDELPSIDGAEGFGGGWVGYLGYGLGRRIEDVSAPPPRPVALPAFALAYYDHVVRCDPEGRWWFEALWTAPRAAA